MKSKAKQGNRTCSHCKQTDKNATISPQNEAEKRLTLKGALPSTLMTESVGSESSTAPTPFDPACSVMPPQPRQIPHLNSKPKGKINLSEYRQRSKRAADTDTVEDYPCKTQRLLQTATPKATNTTKAMGTSRVSSRSCLGSVSHTLKMGLVMCS